MRTERRGEDLKGRDIKRKGEVKREEDFNF
jgi:hypothetical protein